jgi:hypothetical protein
MARSVFRSISLLLALAPAAFAADSAPLEGQPLFKAVVAGEHCLGRRLTMLEEIRLADALRRAAGRPVTSLEVSQALSAARRGSKPDCTDAGTLQSLARFQNEVRAALQDPIRAATQAHPASGQS